MARKKEAEGERVLRKTSEGTQNHGGKTSADFIVAVRRPVDRPTMHQDIYKIRFYKFNILYILYINNKKKIIIL